MADDDLFVPKTVVAKIAAEASDGLRVAPDARDILVKCCQEIIQMLASEANELCAKRKKKTIGAEDVIASLESLELHQFLKAANEANDAYKKEQEALHTKKKSRKLENSGVSMEELQRQQEELFKKAAMQRSMSMQSSDQPDAEAAPAPTSTVNAFATDAPKEEDDDDEEMLN
eukprot:m.299783 g.299783  ORF g.299783 m.299783 type:complete len:173 (+) comp14243_c0_seq1:757-1275(+)